jgi:rhamnose utilization protein RhaD (predicted bifunctional aldolase and dehydrogenase)
MRQALESFCARIGADPLLVQGAGGNASWKADDTLWVKASGTWLAMAGEQGIFVPVDLAHLKSAIASGDFAVTPRPSSSSTLRPSIETLLHALMPHPVVVHLHAVEVLAHLVRASFPLSLERGLDSRTSWIGVPYHKPGAELARAIAEGMARAPKADVVMMQSHGVVIGGRDVAEVENRLAELTGALTIDPRPKVRGEIAVSALFDGAYQPAPDDLSHQLALDPVLFARLERDWILYPDHVVFLGPSAAQYQNAEDFLASCPDRSQWPDILFLKGKGVFVRQALTDAKLAQLRCYYDVITRQDAQEQLMPLSPQQVAELLNWDAEKYRKSISR